MTNNYVQSINPYPGTIYPSPQYFPPCPYVPRRCECGRLLKDCERNKYMEVKHTPGEILWYKSSNIYSGQEDDKVCIKSIN